MFMLCCNTDDSFPHVPPARPFLSARYTAFVEGEIEWPASRPIEMVLLLTYKRQRGRHYSSLKPTCDDVHEMEEHSDLFYSNSELEV
jgi:hypothetical protein